jgi:predicted dinucleotide-binding enzyme
MKITTIGRGNVGGGLARLWRAAGHEVTELGSEGGDAADADVILLAVPSRAIDDALAAVLGVEGKTVIDATNAFTGRAAGFDSLAHQVKARTGGPVAKSFNLNFARLYDQIAEQRRRPSNLYAADDEAREVTEQLSRDAGYEPVYAGNLENARALEDFLGPLGAIGRVFHRFAQPGEL